MAQKNINQEKVESEIKKSVYYLKVIRKHLIEIENDLTNLLKVDNQTNPPQTITKKRKARAGGVVREKKKKVRL